MRRVRPHGGDPAERATTRARAEADRKGSRPGAAVPVSAVLRQGAGRGVDPGFTHQRSEVERYAKSGNFRASLALRNVPVSKPRRVVVGRAQLLPKRLDA